MDGEHLFSDAKRFKAVYDLVVDDLKDRRTWFERAEMNRDLRYRRKNTDKPVYPAAPNLVEPIIADTIRELKQVVVTTLWQAPRLAQFIGLDEVGVSHAEAAEAAFDFHLRKTPRSRARIAQCVDDELMYGHGVAKLVEKPGRNGMPIPDFVAVSPLSVAVPTSTLEMESAERVCHMMRFTLAEFRRAAQAGAWNPTAVAEAITAAAERKANPSADRGNARTRYREGALSDSRSGVDVWEIYYESDVGRRVCLLCPDCPDVPLTDKPWVWVTLVGREESAPVRSWPFVQFRNEDTAGFYNTGGVPEILEVDQKEASAARTVRAIGLDFAGKPFLKGQKGTQPFRFRAGENIGQQEIVWFKTPAAEQRNEQDFTRNLAMMRVGSSQGYSANLVRGADRKSATEVQAVMSVANGMAVDSVDRFAEPWAEIFSMMWVYLSRQALLCDGQTGMTVPFDRVLPAEVWSAEYCISAGVSGRSMNQIRTLGAMTNLGQLAPVVSDMMTTLGASAVREFYLWIFGTLDTELARRVAAAGKAEDGGRNKDEG